MHCLTNGWSHGSQLDTTLQWNNVAIPVHYYVYVKEEMATLMSYWSLSSIFRPYL